MRQMGWRGGLPALPERQTPKRTRTRGAGKTGALTAREIHSLVQQAQPSSRRPGRRGGSGTGAWRTLAAQAAVERYQPPALDCLEDIFQEKVLWVLRQHGYLCYHAYSPLRDQAGYPDLDVVLDVEQGAGIEIDGEHFVAELKTETGRVSPEQRRWLRSLAAAGVETHVWRPSHWLDILRRAGATTEADQLERQAQHNQREQNSQEEERVRNEDVTTSRVPTSGDHRAKGRRGQKATGQQKSAWPARGANSLRAI